MVDPYLTFVIIDIAVILFLAFLFSNRFENDLSFGEGATLYVVSFCVASLAILYWVFTSW